MGTDRYDVIVVGAGIAGLTAAAAVASCNLKVALVATGPGSFVSGPGWLNAQGILQASAEPGLQEAIAFFCEMARLAGCQFAGDISAARFLPSLLGDFHSVSLAPLSLWNSGPRDGVATAIAGVRGLSCFDENFIAQRLTEQARKLSFNCTYTARQISFSREMGIPVTTLRIAQCFDRDPDFRAELIEALQKAATGFARILVPGMLGLESSSEQVAQFESEVGCPVGEIPTLPPSIPGLRVFHRLERHLHNIGVELYRGFPVETVEMHDDVCTGMTIASPGRAMNLRCDCAVMATGRRSASLLGEKFARLDPQLHPVTSSGAVIALNVFVAGSVVQSGDGDSGNVSHILTGYRAGNLAASTRGNHAAR
jgi:glycerol-3-phosphate dehydrogenase subunit B